MFFTVLSKFRNHDELRNCRVCIDPNFHDICLMFLHKVNSPVLDMEILKATYANCKVILTLRATYERYKNNFSSIIVFVYADIIKIRYYQILFRRTHITEKYRYLVWKICHSMEPGPKHLCRWPNTSYSKGIAFALEYAFCDIIDVCMLLLTM